MENGTINRQIVITSDEGQEYQLASKGSSDLLSDGLWFLACSAKMLHIRQQILSIASVEAPVFITGDSGVGKEMAARMLHLRSARRKHPFVRVNCAALPEDLLESELFGYEHGAFTGATRAKHGYFEHASGGTLFLDEIAEMSPRLQAKLLHVLQDGQYAPLGSRELIRADVRVVAATNVNVKERIQSGSLRGDLYYRLNVFSIHVPSLSERPSEIPMLFRHFHHKYNAKFKMETAPPSEGLLEAAMRYRWPGNVRELENFVKRYVILGDDQDSTQELRTLVGPQQGFGPAEPDTSICEQGLKASVRGWRDIVETQLIAAALAQTCWNRKQSAKVLGISYRALLNRLERRGLRRRRNEIGTMIPDTAQTRTPLPIHQGAL